MEAQNIQIGDQSAFVQGDGNTIHITVNGEVQEIKNDLAELKALAQRLELSALKTAQGVVSVAELTEGSMGYLTQKNAFNHQLVRKLLEALAANHADGTPISPRAAKVLQKANQAAPDWEVHDRFAHKIKDTISRAYVGLVGVQLRKLWAIGTEEGGASKYRNYVKYCHLVAQQTVQLLCFALLSGCWDAREQRQAVPNEAQAKVLAHFMDGAFALSLPEYLTLLHTLLQLFQEHKLPLPIPEAAALREALAPDGPLASTCAELQGLADLPAEQLGLLSCQASETHLTALLVPLAFLARYHMVSVKRIGYQELRHQPPRYLHHVTTLQINSQSQALQEEVNYEDQPAPTETILLYPSQDHSKAINLFPFMIDLNALEEESGAKVCLFSDMDYEDKVLNYHLMENGSTIKVPYKNVGEKAEDLDDVMADAEDRKQWRLDTVWEQFQAAKTAILGDSPAANPEDPGTGDDDDFWDTDD